MKKTALITGANRGIGFAIAKLLAEAHSFRVFLSARNLIDAQAAAKQISGDVIPVKLDLGEIPKIETQVTDILSKTNQIDVLINNAAVLHPGNLLEASESDFDESLKVNFIAAYKLIKILSPKMIQNNYGRIVNVSSAWGSFDQGLSGPATYSITKAALNSLTLSLSQSLPRTVKINAVCPGWVRTRMGGLAADRSPEEAAVEIARLATIDSDGPSGGFYQNNHLIDW